MVHYYMLCILSPSPLFEILVKATKYPIFIIKMSKIFVNCKNFVQFDTIDSIPGLLTNLFWCVQLCHIVFFAQLSWNYVKTFQCSEQISSTIKTWWWWSTALDKASKWKLWKLFCKLLVKCAHLYVLFLSSLYASFDKILKQAENGSATRLQNISINYREMSVEVAGSRG